MAIRISRMGFAGRANLGNHIDAAVAAGKADRAIELMRQSERRLTLKRRRIGERMRAARTPEDSARALAEMNAINAVMDDICFNLRDPKGYLAFHHKSRVHRI